MRTDTTKIINPREEFIFKIEIPNALSYMVFPDPQRFYSWHFRPGVWERGARAIYVLRGEDRAGAVAIQTLKELKKAKERGDEVTYAALREKFNDPVWIEEYYKHISDMAITRDRELKELIPNVKLNFYAFHVMVILGTHFLIFTIVALWLSIKNRWGDHKWLLWVALITIPMPWIASQAGWVLAELGRQPWVVYELMPTISAVTRLKPGAVQLTFWIFLATFTLLFIAEIRIMISQIKKGPGGK